MTRLGLNLSEFINGVAKKHTEVSRNMFPGYEISAITNGVHTFTWTCDSFKRLYDKYLPGWANEPELFVRDGRIPDDEIWDAHLEAKKILFEYVRAKTGIMLNLLLALSNPAVYLPAILKAVSLGQQASTLDVRRAGGELVLSTLLGVAAMVLFWLGLRLCPSLWMYVLWSVLFASWFGKRLYGLVQSGYSRGFWQDGLITTFILLGPMLQDSANAPDMLIKLAMRIALFIGVALYAWLMVYWLEEWRARRYEKTVIKENVLC